MYKIKPKILQKNNNNSFKDQNSKDSLKSATKRPLNWKKN